MTPAELKSYLDLTKAIAHHKQALNAAVKEKQQLAQTLYVRYGRHAVYRITEEGQTQDLMVGRTSAATYYFAPRVRFPKESRLAKAEQQRIDRAARMQAFPTQESVTRPQPPVGTTTLPTQAEIEDAMKQGRYDRDHATAERAAKHAPAHEEDSAKVRLPIVGNVEQPPAPIEPRLLEIQEPSGVLFGDDAPEPSSSNS